jgi:hypothetical protein
VTVAPWGDSRDVASDEVVYSCLLPLLPLVPLLSPLLLMWDNDGSVSTATGGCGSGGGVCFPSSDKDSKVYRSLASKGACLCACVPRQPFKNIAVVVVVVCAYNIVQHT